METDRKREKVHFISGGWPNKPRIYELQEDKVQGYSSLVDSIEVSKAGRGVKEERFK